MISVGSRDWRQGSGISLGFSVPRMDEADLEEGEACPFQDDDPSIDPDTAFSYLDAKIQDLLGHCQKDFEGGVSAEKLGAQFGGYGSFLPTQPRSPQNRNTRSTPNNVQVQGGRFNYAVTTSAPQAEGVLDSVIAAPSSAFALPSATDSEKSDPCKPSNPAQEVCPTVTTSDQKMLKVRIKVGSENISDRKMAELYSGLGLDISPSSSLDKSPTESEGFFHVPQAPDESPTSILQMMTSFPVHGGHLLSPLSDDLLHLNEKGSHLKGDASIPSSSWRGLVSSKGDEKASGNKKTKWVEKYSFPVELENGGKKDAHNGINVAHKRESELDMVSNTLKLPVLANSYLSDGTNERADRVGSLPKQASMEILAKEKLPEPVPVKMVGSSENPNGMAWGNNMTYSCKYADCKDGKIFSPSKADSNASNVNKDQNAELSDPPKQKTSPEVKSREPCNFKAPNGKELLFSGGQKKSKGSQNHGNSVLDVSKENMKANSSLFPKIKKHAHSDGHLPKSEIEVSKMQKDLVKTSDRYKDFVGDVKSEGEENGAGALEMPPEVQMGFEAVEKSTSVVNGASKDACGGHKFDKASKLGTPTKAASNAAPISGSGHISDAASVLVGPPENWVQCDKCAKWRLLPVRANPEDFEGSWVCSMLDWLPNMNRCCFSEEEIAMAVRVRYQVPFPASKSPLDHEDASASAVNLADVQNPELDHKNPCSQSMHSHGKNHGLKQLSNASNQGFHNRLSKPTKKAEALVKSRSSSGLNQPAIMNELDVNSSGMEKHRHKQKRKHDIHGHSSHGGDTRNVTLKNRRVIDQDHAKVSKKIKMEEKAGCISNSDFPGDAPVRDFSKHKGHSSNAKDNLTVLVKKPKSVSMDGRPVDTAMHENKETSKKRKEKDCQSDGIYSGPIPNKGQLSNGSKVSVKQEACESGDGKRKKMKLLKCEGRESNGTKTNSGTGKIGSLQPSLAATSSSSKVSGSHKTKANLQSLKGSPVDSVSSSPLRNSNPDVPKSAGQNIFGKNGSQDDVFPAPCSPRRRLTGENDGRSDRPGISRTDKNSRDMNFSHPSASKAKPERCLPGLANCIAPTADGVEMGHDIKCSSEPQAPGRSCNLDLKTENLYRSSGLHSRKPGMGSASQSEDHDRSCKSESDGGKFRNLNSPNNNHDRGLLDKTMEGGNKLHVKSGSKPDKFDKGISGKKCKFSEQSKRGSRTKSEGLDVIREDNIGSHDTLSARNQNQLMDCHDEGLSKRFQQPVSGPQKGPGSVALPVAASESVDEFPVSKLRKSVDNPSATEHLNSRQSTPNGIKSREVDVRSPARRDSTSQAANSAMREARDLKHMADRLKNSVSNLQFTGLYFQAALKFLHGASLMESSNSVGTKHADLIQSMDIYSWTAKLCGFCAREYERVEGMAAAASLAYKCMEVAFMRVVYSSNATAGNDRHELLVALHMVPPGESPSSSASDIDNLNNPAMAEKFPLAKGVYSPQVAGNHVFTARNRSSFVHLLTFAQNANSAMEASRKSRAAFAAAADAGQEDAQYKEGISLVKRALDFSFQDVEGLLHLTRHAMEAISGDDII